MSAIQEGFTDFEADQFKLISQASTDDDLLGETHIEQNKNTSCSAGAYRLGGKGGLIHS